MRGHRVIAIFIAAILIIAAMIFVLFFLNLARVDFVVQNLNNERVSIFIYGKDRGELMSSFEVMPFKIKSFPAKLNGEEYSFIIKDSLGGSAILSGYISDLIHGDFIIVTCEGRMIAVREPPSVW